MTTTIIPHRQRGECPSLSKPMPTGDGLLARINPINGAISPADLLSVAEAAKRFGNGLLEVTLRGSLQIRGLRDETVADMNAAVEALGLTIRTGLPLDIAPLAGLCAEERADPRPLADAIKSQVSSFAAQLGPKVSVVVDGGGPSMLRGVKADIRLTALNPDTWQVAIAGDAETATLIGAYGAGQAAEAAVALLRVIADGGRKMRGRDLLGNLNRLRTTLPVSRSVTAPSVLPDISPSRGATRSFTQGARSGSEPQPANLAELSEVTADAGQISPLEGEMSGRTERGMPGPNPSATPRLHPGDILPLTDNRVAAIIALPFGTVTAETLAGLCADLQKLGIRELRLSPDRMLIILCPDHPAAQAALNLSTGFDVITNPDDPRLRIVACAGAPACASAHLNTHALAAELAAKLANGQDLPFLLHLSGCEKECSKPSGTFISVIGIPGSRKIVANGIVLPPDFSDTLMTQTPMQRAS